MKFLVDAQLPARLARFLSSAGHDALHTTALPDGNRTGDGRIAELADGEGRGRWSADWALAETTPGPLIMVVQFVTFLGAYRDPGSLDPWVAAVLGRS